MSKQPPIPMEELIRWCEANRPDTIESLKSIEAAAKEGHAGSLASMYLISIAFQAGRTFQRAPQNADVFLPIAKDPYT